MYMGNIMVRICNFVFTPLDHNKLKKKNYKFFSSEPKKWKNKNKE